MRTIFIIRRLALIPGLRGHMMGGTVRAFVSNSDWVCADSSSEEGVTPPRLRVPKGPVAAQLAEIYTIGLHSSYTAENWHVMCNENNVMQKFYHPLRMTAELFISYFRLLIGSLQP